ncbi:HTH-type transcriptional repressor CsiR [Paracoccus haematequi]|uniref:HTH-type transcriptional repressor CsiR n=2 Tax=Paracoccus haematequi TaxID=2491866 RepID=A0A3S4EUH3_9RHOB|nr:HTH-type transcriptional repressor CsiR [Paracoccus haematequi]
MSLIEDHRLITGSESVARSHSERAMQLLRADIVEGILAPGLKLKLDMLRDRYEIGAAPLREALSRLAGEGLVIAQEQRGFVVSGMSAEEANDLGELRLLLEIEALRDSLSRGNEAWQNRVITSYHWLERAEQSSLSLEGRLDELERRNFDFHEALVSACERRWTLHLRGIVFRQHERYRRLSRIHTAKTRLVSDEHRALLDAALERNEDAAIAVITTHIRRTTRAVGEALQAADQP